MSDSKNTSAFRVFRVELGTANSHCFDDQIIDTKTGNCVAFTDFDTPAGKNIAAAPDLLEALKAILPEAINDRYLTQSAAVEAARAAIAKAEGVEE